MVLIDFSIQKLLFYTLLTISLLKYILYLWKRRDIYINSWNYPGPINLPLIGAAYLTLTPPGNIINVALALLTKYADGIKIWVGHKLVYGISEPSQVEKLLGSYKALEKDGFYEVIAGIIGNGILSLPVPTWKRHRKHIAPTFNQQILNTFVEIFAERSLVLNQILTKNCNKKFDLFKCMSRCMLDITIETTMNLQLNVQEEESDYSETIAQMMKLMNKKVFHLWNHNDFIWRILGYKRKMDSYLKKYNSLVDKALKTATDKLPKRQHQEKFVFFFSFIGVNSSGKFPNNIPGLVRSCPNRKVKIIPSGVIQHKMEAMELRKNNGSSLSHEDEGCPKRLVFLDYILERGMLSAEEIRDEINIFLFAATDTTATALTFLFAVIGMYPEIQQNMFEEVIQVMDNERAPSFKDLPLLTYTERVIKETLRLFPPAAFFARYMTEDMDMGDFIIPRDSTVFFVVMYMHRNPKYWPDPLKFDPDRFLPEKVAERHPGAYIPFSFGPRNCIGMKYAMMNMKTIVSTVIRKFVFHSEYKTIDDIKFKNNLLLRFDGDIKVTVTPRK